MAPPPQATRSKPSSPRSQPRCSRSHPPCSPSPPRSWPGPCHLAPRATGDIVDKVPAPLKVLINSVHPCLPQASATYSSMQSAPARTEVLLRVVILLLLAQHGHLDPDARSKPNFENICTEQTTYKKRAPVQRTGGNSASPIASTQTHALRRSLQPRPPSIWADHAVDLSKNLVVSLSFHAPIFVRLSSVIAPSAGLKVRPAQTHRGYTLNSLSTTTIRENQIWITRVTPAP